MPLAPGARLGPYEIIAPIGAGGMGEVFRARDTRLGRDVALKILPSSVATLPDRLRRFAQEAQAAAALNHPNVDRRLRRAHRRRHAVRRVGVARRRDAARGAGARGAGAAPRRRDCHAGGGRPRGRPPEGHRPPRREAREHLPHRRRPRETARLRPRTHRGSGRRASPSRPAPPIPRDATRTRARHGGLHGARAGARRARRLACRRVRARGRLLRDAHGPPGVPGRDVGGSDGGHRAIGSAGDAIRRRCRPDSTAPSDGASRRSPAQRFQSTNDLAYALDALVAGTISTPASSGLGSGTGPPHRAGSPAGRSPRRPAAWPRRRLDDVARREARTGRRSVTRRRRSIGFR